MSNVVAYTGSNIDDFALWAKEIRETRIERITKRARIRLANGNWRFRGTAHGLLDGDLHLIENDVGTIGIELPIARSKLAPFTGSNIDDFALWAAEMENHRSTFLAHWALDQDKRGTSNIHVVVEKDGARIGGRTDPKSGVTLKHSPDGDRVVLSFLDDMNELRNLNMAAAPFLPPGLIQEPKAQFLYAPVDWGGLATIGMNMARLQGTNLNLELDILDSSTWHLGMWAEAQIVPIPKPLISSNAPATIISGNIKQSWLDVMAPRLEDAELIVVPRRFIDGDPEPFPGGGTAWRQGTLFVDIQDRSGWRHGTCIGGNLASGLFRTIANATANHVEDVYDVLGGSSVEIGDYQIPALLGTRPSHPFAVYRDGDLTGVENFELIRGAGGACRITAGGRSMPGVNELYEAVISYAGDVLGDNLVINGYGVGSLGGILTSFLMPILGDSTLAYMSVPLIGRAAEQGWGHDLETACTNVSQAYTPAATMDLRRRRRETDPTTTFTFQVVSGLPWLIGDNGQGHWWLGDRVGGNSKHLGARVFVSRCRELSLPLGGDEPPVWKATFGDPRAKQDALERVVSVVGTGAAALQEIGLW